MKEKYLIIREPDLFKGKYILCYRLVICHAIFKLIKSEGISDVENLLSNLLLKVDSNFKKSAYRDVPFYKPSFMEIYPFLFDSEMEEKCGIVVIDRSGGCFPLVLYPEDTNQEHGDRIDAFVYALSDIRENFNNRFLPIIQNAINDPQGWDSKIVESLRQNFKHRANT